MFSSSSTRLTILTSGKKNHLVLIAETGGHSPLGLQIYFFIISENADCIDFLYGKEGGGGGGCKEEYRE